MIVDQNDPDLLRQAILKLMNNNKLCKELVINAKNTAKKYHDSSKISTQLQHLLNFKIKNNIDINLI